MRLNLLQYFLLLLGFVYASGVFAETQKCGMEIKDNSVFVGSWVLDSTRPTMINGSKSTHEIWEFAGDGGFKLTAQDHRASGTITSASTYVVENNTLKIARIGRAGKFYIYRLCVLEDSKMTLFGGLEGFHFFSK